MQDFVHPFLQDCLPRSLPSADRVSFSLGESAHGAGVFASLLLAHQCRQAGFLLGFRMRPNPNPGPQRALGPAPLSPAGKPTLREAEFLPRSPSSHLCAEDFSPAYSPSRALNGWLAEAGTTAGVQALVPAGPAQAWPRDYLRSLLIVFPTEVALEPPCPPNDPKPPGQGLQAKFLEVHVSVSVCMNVCLCMCI